MTRTNPAEHEVIDVIKNNKSIDDISAALIYAQGIQMGKMLERQNSSKPT